MVRTILFWLHLVAGVIAGSIILVMSVTGVLLTYEKQMVAWADARQLAPVKATASTPLSADSLVTLARIAHPDGAPSGITRRNDPAAPVQVAFGREGVLFLDPYTGTELGRGDQAMRKFFGSVEEWHRWLAGKDENRKLGKQITGISNLMFLVLVLTGMVLWLPRTWTWVRVRAVLWFRGGLSGKARDFNWHNVLGLWSAFPLIVIVASGTVIGYPWASNLVFRLAGEQPPAQNGPPGGGPPGDARGPSARPAGAPAGERGVPAMADARSAAGPNEPAAAPAPTPRVSFEAAMNTAVALMPEWRTATVQIPKPNAKTISVSLDAGTGGQPQLRSTVQIAAATGAVDKYQPFDSLTAGRRARSVLRFAHTGEVLGIVGQTIAGLVSLASVVLVVTGIALALRRAAAALRRRRRPAASASAVAASGD